MLSYIHDIIGQSKDDAYLRLSSLLHGRRGHEPQRGSKYAAAGRDPIAITAAAAPPILGYRLLRYPTRDVRPARFEQFGC